MEKVDGKTLREVLFSGSVPVKRLLQVATQIADGLARAHEAGIGDKLRLGSVDLVFRAFPPSGSTETAECK